MVNWTRRAKAGIVRRAHEAMTRLIHAPRKSMVWTVVQCDNCAKSVWVWVFPIGLAGGGTSRGHTFLNRHLIKI